MTGGERPALASTFLLLLVLLLPVPRPVLGQEADAERFTLVVRGVPLSQALEALVQTAQIDLVYTSDLVSGKSAYCTGRAMTAGELVACVLAGTRLDYVRSSSGAFVLVDAVGRPARTGDLSGRVVDALTGEPLPYANILLAEASAGTVSNDDGLFSVSALVTGRHRLVVTYVGYETTVDSVWIAPGGQERVRIALRPKETTLAPIVVDGLAQRVPSSGLGRGELEGRSLADLAPAGTADVVRGATTVSGVAAQQPLADLHIQGGATGEHLTLLDGVPVRDPVSLGRHLGAFSPLAIDRVTVHKAGFGAEHGSHLSGVINVEHDLDAGAGRRAAFSVDPISLNGRTQLRLGDASGVHGTAMAAVRSSIWGLVRDPGVTELLEQWNAVDPLVTSRWIDRPVTASSIEPLHHRPSIAFSDVHAAARLQLSPFRTLHASVYRARNEIDSDFAAVNRVYAGEPGQLVQTHDEYDWANWAAQVRHSWLLGSRSVVSAQAQGSWHASSYVYYAAYGPLDGTGPGSPAGLPGYAYGDAPVSDEANPVSDEANDVRELSLRLEATRSLAPDRHLDAGLSATHLSTRFRLGNPFVAPFHHAADAWDLAGYAAARLGVGLRTAIEPSVRLTYVPGRQTLYAEPRLALRHDGTTASGGAWAARAAGGIYRQFINPFELTSSGSTTVVPVVLFWLPTDRALAPPRAYHLTAEGLLAPAPRWTLNLEVYHKWQPRLLTVDYRTLVNEHPAVRPASEPATLPQDAFITPTSGRAFGGGLRARFEDARGAATLTYSFSRARQRFPGRFDDRRVPVPWNEPHRLGLDLRLRVRRALHLDATWRGGWGRSWGYRRIYYDYLAPRADAAMDPGLELDDPSQQTLPPYYRLDLGLTFTPALPVGTLDLRFYVVNVLDRRNVYDRSLVSAEPRWQSLPRLLPGRHPVLALRFGF